MGRFIKNIIFGATSIFSVAPPLRRPSLKKHYKPHKSAAEALKSDWEKVGGDIDWAFKRVVNGQK